MKKLKTLIALTAAAAFTVVTPLFLTVSTTGCANLSGGGSVTNNPAQIAATSLILQNAAYSGALAAITPPTGNPNNAAYFTLASQSIGVFLTGTNYSPAAFQQALINVHAPQATNLWVQLGTATVIDLYQVYFSQYVEGSVNGNAAAISFLTAIQTGFNRALGTNSPNVPPAPPVPTPAIVRSVLPRTLK